MKKSYSHKERACDQRMAEAKKKHIYGAYANKPASLKAREAFERPAFLGMYKKVGA